MFTILFTSIAIGAISGIVLLQAVTLWHKQETQKAIVFATGAFALPIFTMWYAIMSAAAMISEELQRTGFPIGQ